jgi:Inner membrane protein YgaP-like, transmembrane domain
MPRPILHSTPDPETAMSRLNVGNVDRLLRMLLGIALIALAGGGFIGAWGYLGVVPLLTGISALCPLYSLLGITTTSR